MRPEDTMEQPSNRRAIMKLTTIITATALCVSGCATYRPIIDTEGVDQAALEYDLYQCQRYAQQIDPSTHAAAGAVIGAGIAVAIGAALGLRGRDLQQLAAGNAVAGAVAGGGQGAVSQIEIIRRCMAGRGYRVLD